MRHSPVSITLLLGIVLVLAWVVLTIMGSSSATSEAYPVGASPDSESPVSQEEMNQRLNHAQAGVIHNASWSFLMTIPHR